MTKPVRLEKQEEKQNDFIQTIKCINALIKTPEFWIIILILLGILILIDIALMESTSNLWYNRGLIGI